MTPDSVVQLVRDALMMAFWLSVPVLVVGFAASVVISLRSDRDIHSGRDV